MAVVTVVVALVFGLAPPAAAHRTAATERSRQQGIDQEIQRLQDELGDLSTDEHDLAHRMEDARTRRLELDGQLAVLDRDIAEVEADLASATERLQVSQSEVDQARRQVTRARARLRKARDDVRDRAVAAYVNNPGSEIAGAVFEAHDLRSFGARTAYAKTVVEAHARTVERLRVARDDAAAARREHQAALDVAVAARDTIEVQRAELEERHHAQAGLRAAAVAHEEHERGLLDEVRDRRAGYESRLAALRRESDTISVFLRSIQAGQAVVAGSGQLSVPISGARLTSQFGPRVHPIFGTQRLHAGVDWAVPTGTPVRAAAAGRVVHAGDRGGYGRTVIIDHGGSLATLYAHLSVVSVGNGQNVERGQVIGAVGSTGFSTGPHLHFEVRVAGNPVDPLPYL